MEFRVNESHLKMKKTNTFLKRNVILTITGIVIGIGIFSGCSKLKKMTKEEEEYATDVAANISNETVEVTLNEETASYDVSTDDGKKSFDALPLALTALGLSASTNILLAAKLKNSQRKPHAQNYVYNFDYSNNVGRKKRVSVKS